MIAETFLVVGMAFELVLWLVLSRVLLYFSVVSDYSIHLADNDKIGDFFFPACA